MKRLTISRLCARKPLPRLLWLMEVSTGARRAMPRLLGPVLQQLEPVRLDVTILKLVGRCARKRPFRMHHR